MPDTDGWEAVKDPTDRRRVMYWRFLRDGACTGGIRRDSDGAWVASDYTGGLSPFPVVGRYLTRREAERAVTALTWKDMPT